MSQFSTNSMSSKRLLQHRSKDGYQIQDNEEDQCLSNSQTSKQTAKDIAKAAAKGGMAGGIVGAVSGNFLVS